MTTIKQHVEGLVEVRVLYIMASNIDWSASVSSSRHPYAGWRCDGHC